ncbi:MAG TPA: hypothetical protein PKY77_19675 [Phycisphaerae bacterium]|nr:hypothetical protein [Phycisphaerae bacterium]HRY70703.1 hypothetical protein [Phycisphaerae bacterium]HSA28702.1 hypothetical protein [Phycisphaerae bacterium]
MIWIPRFPVFHSPPHLVDRPHRPTGRAFGDLLDELDMYSLVRSRVLSRGRYGRTREIILDLSEELIEKIHAAVRMNFEMRQ